MLSACVGDTDPAGPDGTWSEALAPEADNQNSQGSFELAAPDLFAAVDLRTHVTDSGHLATARVAIVDEGGEPVSGVAVYGLFTADMDTDVQARTDASGVATFESILTSDAPVGFEVELVGYEIGGELAYLRPFTLDAGDFATFTEHDGVAEGMGTSSGSQENDLEDGSGDDLEPNASSRTADDTTDNGMGTSSGTTSDENPDDPTDSGMGTSSGDTELN